MAYIDTDIKRIYLEEGICIYGTKVFSIKKDEFLGNLKNPFFLCVLPKEMFFK
jgi:hypothetical protein